MKRANRNKTSALGNRTGLLVIAVGFLAACAWTPVWAFDDVPPRVSYIDGTAAYEPAGDVDWSEVTLNLPLLSGDRVISHPDSRIEIELGYDNFLRLGENTDLVFRRVDNHLELDLAVGDLILRVNDKANFRINLPSASVRIKKEGLYRFSAEEDGYARVAVRKGVAEVSNSHRERRVRAGEELIIEHPQSSLTQVSYASREDDLDVWSDRRDAQFVSSQSAQYVGGRYAGVYDLDRYGEWRHVSLYGGTVWFPFPSSGWSPYLVGSWSWVPGWGFTWISFEPWGWLPYHYGRWAYYRDYGRWCWIPGGFSRWSPSLVDFYYGGGYVGWAPRGYAPGLRGRGGNVTVINNNTTIVNGGGWNRPGFRDGLTVVPENRFRTRDRVDRVALDAPARAGVTEVMRPTVAEDLRLRSQPDRSRSNLAPTAGVGGPRVTAVGRSGGETSNANRSGAAGAAVAAPSSSGWNGASRRTPETPRPTAAPEASRGGRSPAVPPATTTTAPARERNSAVAPPTTRPPARPSGASWTDRNRGADRSAAPAVRPSTPDRTVAPTRSRPPVRTAPPPSRTRDSRSFSGNSGSSRPPARVSPSRPSAPRGSVSPRSSSPPRSSVSRPAARPSSPPARAARPVNRERPPR